MSHFSFVLVKMRVFYYNINMSNSLIRIKEIGSFIYPYSIIADVGCDHGYLVACAFEDYNIKKAYAIDNKKGPLDSAINNLKNKPYFRNIVFSLSDGINEIGDDTECVVIAGMGGTLIASILDSDLKNVKRLILEPNRDEKIVRHKVVSLGFAITKEVVVFEKGKYYEIIVCDKIDDLVSYTEEEYEFGPVLLKERSVFFKEKWFAIYEKLKDIDDDEVRNRVERIKKVL